MEEFMVLLFYKYITIKDPLKLKDLVTKKATELGLKGRIIISNEGINGTVEGNKEKAEEFSFWLKNFPELNDLNIKQSKGEGDSFPKLSIKIREEIVGTKFPKHINPEIQTAPHLRAEELKKLYDSNQDFVVIDMRNDYEYESGHFKNSVNPNLGNSRDLPKVIDDLKIYKDKKVITVCTGGVRCEKMSAYLIDQGFKNVHQLENGIHTYMEKYPGSDFLGTLYTFDNRITMDFGGDRTIVGKCLHCQSKTERYTNCVNIRCNKHFLICENCQNLNNYCKECLSINL